MCTEDLCKEEDRIKNCFADKELYFHVLPDIEDISDFTFYKIYMKVACENDIVWLCDGWHKERRLRVLKDCLHRLEFTVYGKKMVSEE